MRVNPKLVMDEGLRKDLREDLGFLRQEWQKGDSDHHLGDKFSDLLNQGTEEGLKRVFVIVTSRSASSNHSMTTLFKDIFLLLR